MTRTFSKIYGLAALRLGWAYAAPEITDVLNRLRGPFNVSSPAIYAGIAALGDEDFVARARVHNRVERLKMAKEMSEIGLEVLPSVANFLLLRFKGGAAQADSALAFLMGQGIILRAMKGYGLADCLRVTIGSIEENQVFCNALRVFLDGE
jgi:histidinol-phosphate aminotransferase